MNRWEQGRTEVDELLADGRLTPVAANRELADQYLATARVRLTAAKAISRIDPEGGFALTYDPARLALAAILINQGLRPRGEGAHAVLLEVVMAQLVPPPQPEFRQFSWMRRLCNDTQYPDADRPTATLDDLNQALPAAPAIIERAALIVPAMPPY